MLIASTAGLGFGHVLAVVAFIGTGLNQIRPPVQVLLGKPAPAENTCVSPSASPVRALADATVVTQGPVRHARGL
jgi:hypothetical protein